MSSIPNSGERPLTAILSSVFGNVQEIVRSEVRLAKTEAREAVTEYLQGASWLATALLSAFFAVGFLLGAGFFALSYIVPQWAAALIMAGALAFISGLALAVRNSIVNSVKSPQTDLAQARVDGTQPQESRA